jgi:hypothetical protein
MRGSGGEGSATMRASTRNESGAHDGCGNVQSTAGGCGSRAGEALTQHHPAACTKGVHAGGFSHGTVSPPTRRTSINSRAAGNNRLNYEKTKLDAQEHNALDGKSQRTGVWGASTGRFLPSWALGLPTRTGRCMTSVMMCSYPLTYTWFPPIAPVCTFKGDVVT